MPLDKGKPYSVETARLLVVLATMAINIIGVSALSLASWSDWRTGVALNVIDNILLVGFAVWRRDEWMAKLIVFGLVIGFAELPVDAWLVNYTHTLDYSIGGGPMLWRSPMWMPLAWEVVAVQFGFLGVWMWDHCGQKWGLVIMALLGMCNIPYYEEMARLIHWWRYHNCRMMSNAPYYVIVGELGIAVGLTLLGRKLRKGGWARVFGLGLAGGAMIFVCYATAWYVIDERGRVAATPIVERTLNSRSFAKKEATSMDQIARAGHKDKFYPS